MFFSWLFLLLFIFVLVIDVVSVVPIIFVDFQGRRKEINVIVYSIIFLGELITKGINM